MVGEAQVLTRNRLAEHPLWAGATAAEPLAGLVLPVVVSGAVADREAVEGPPGGSGVERLSITELLRDARAASALGLRGLLILGASDRKDEHALLASERDHVAIRAIRAVKQSMPDFAVASDVCVCSHTAHGQCVLFREGVADIPGTRARLAEIALVHADAGVDLIVLSGMLEGAAAAVRRALDDAGYDALPLAATIEV
ncbi:MAG: hypothetical protein FJ034_07090, partial [Chloroflexi bacterium]|nr:hypothetical protein [Chloroflexota bacterium]